MTPLTRQPWTLEGTKEAVLLIHGLGGGPYELQWLGESVHRQCGFQVRAMQLPGHEKESVLMPTSGHEDWVDAAWCEYRRLSEAFRKVHIIGFSTGCLVALRIAELHDVSGTLVVLAPFFEIFQPKWVPVEPEVLLRGLPWLSQVPRRPPPLVDPDIRRQVSEVLPFLSMNLNAARNAKALASQVLIDLSRVQVPTFALQGRRDTVVNPSGVYRLEQGLICPNRTVLFDNSDHLLGLDQDRERVFEAVNHFIGGRALPRAT
jgi:carboxylesterase